MFQLPAVHHDVPTTLIPRASKVRTAELAKALLDAGVVQERHVARWKSTDHLQVCQKALSTWLNGRLGTLRALHPTFTLSLGRHDLDQSFDCGPGREEGAVIEQYCGGSVFPIGPSLDRLEALQPRLGATVLRTIEEASWRSAPIYTPTRILDAASHVYWLGSSDETEAIEMNCETDEERRDMAENMVTRKLVESAYPRWALGRGLRRAALGTRTLRTLQKSISDREARSVIDDVIALRELALPERRWNWRDGYFVGFAGVITWGAADQVTFRVLDDFEQMVNENGDYFEDCARKFVKIREAGSMIDWFKEAEQWCKAVTLIDSLMCKLLDGH